MNSEERQTPGATGEPELPRGDLTELGFELGDLVEMTLDAIVFMDAGGIVRYWNRGATLMFGYESGEAVGRNVDFLIPDDLLRGGELDRLRATCRRDGTILDFRTRRLRNDGSTVWVSLARAVLWDDNGHEISVVATLRDITSQRAAEHEIERSRSLALMGELAAKIAHEVKNPLAGIYAALQVLEGQLDAGDPRREVFDSIGEEVMRLNDLTQELLSFARPAEPKLVRADLAEFLEALVGDLVRLSMASDGRVLVDGLERGVQVPFDAALTGQIFKNLILNGLQANGARGAVRLGSHREAGMLVVDVADTGPGIPEQERESIFEPFFTTKTPGTGLGLSIARKNIEAHGGKIRVLSHSGRGAILRVEFPLG